MAPTTTTRGWGRVIGPVVGVAAAIAASAYAILTPVPAALLIRVAFDKGARDTAREMRPYVPTSGISVRSNISYGHRGFDTAFDVFRPAGEREALPAVIWIHGGAWISTSKRHVAPYLRILAARGFAAVGVNYSVAPEETYPTALHQLNDALAAILAKAERLGIDSTRVVLAGDSAGAQLASQLAAITTNPVYAERLGMVPSLTPAQLRGVVLACGIYDFADEGRGRSVSAWGFGTALWAYTGERVWRGGRIAREMSTIDAVTAEFPPAFITGGNGDTLTDTQSRPMADRLYDLGVPVTALFYDDEHRPLIPHEYQFHLDLVEAREALEATVEFLEQVTRQR